jgi:hypothetical protein
MFNRENTTPFNSASHVPLGPTPGFERRKLIYTSKTADATVRNSSGQDIGYIDDIAIDSVTGEIAYAILSLGGLLGIGEHLHPVPWSVLKYEPGENCFSISLSSAELRAAPIYSKAAFAKLRDSDEQFPHNIFAYYGIYT